MNKVYKKYFDLQVKKERIEDKEEFAMTCTICLHTYPSMNSYEIDQRRHAKAFDLRELVACPLCENLVRKSYKSSCPTSTSWKRRNFTFKVIKITLR